MTVATIETEAEREARIIARFTPKQRRAIIRRQHGLFAWFTSDRAYTEMFDRFEREAEVREAQEFADSQRAYFATISRVTTYTGPDYRVRFDGQSTWVRAVEWQYKLAGIPSNKMSRAIWEAPTGTAPAGYTVPTTKQAHVVVDEMKGVAA
jgi:hypothetical protein